MTLSKLDKLFSYYSLDIMLLRTRSRAMALSSLASKNFAFATPMRTFCMRKARKIPPTGSSGDRSTILGYLRELTSQFKKKKLLFRGAMVRPRLFRFTGPRFFTKRGAPSSYTIAYTWSNVAGHGSFLFLALSYLEKDFLNLRLFAVSGISLAMIFQVDYKHKQSILLISY